MILFESEYGGVLNYNDNGYIKLKIKMFINILKINKKHKILTITTNYVKISNPNFLIRIKKKIYLNQEGDDYDISNIEAISGALKIIQPKLKIKPINPKKGIINRNWGCSYHGTLTEWKYESDGLLVQKKKNKIKIKYDLNSAYVCYGFLYLHIESIEEDKTNQNTDETYTIEIKNKGIKGNNLEIINNIVNSNEIILYHENSFLNEYDLYEITKKINIQNK